MVRRLAACAILFSAAWACNEVSTAPTMVAPGHFTSVSAGRNHACALDTLGRGWCWGDNTYGQAGTPIATCPGCVASPAPIESALRFTAISAGSTHTCALTDDGTAYCWGDNALGQLGASGVEGCVELHPCTVTPIAVTGGHHFKSITAGAYGTCAITTTDVLKCWGYQGFTNVVSLVTPTTVRFPATGDSLWSLVGHTDGGLNGCGLTTSGVAACWGQNFYGQLGTGSISSNRSNPTGITLDAVVKSVSNGSGFACALSSVGDAYCWGLSDRGGLGLGAGAASSPCAVSAIGLCFPVPLKVIGGRTMSQLTVGYEHVCGLDALTSEAYCWGSNTYSAIGSPSLGVSPVASSPFPAGDGVKYTSLSAGRLFTCGIMQDKNISCWGNNLLGQLGVAREVVLTTGIPVRILVSAK